MTDQLEIRGLESSKVWDYENGYYWFSANNRMGKMIAHYELYKRVLGLAGDVLELGVYKGASLVRWATFRDLLEAGHSRRIVAFDAFGTFPKDAIEKPEDQQFIDRFESAGGDGLSPDEIQDILRGKGIAEGVDIVAGDVRATLSTYIESRPALRIALLHLDMDVYEPTKYALEQLWDRIVPGGVVVVDDYNAVAGATEAVDEFMQSRGIGKIEKLPISHVPAFITKP
jgi:hypothetical protein